MIKHLLTWLFSTTILLYLGYRVVKDNQAFREFEKQPNTEALVYERLDRGALRKTVVLRDLRMSLYRKQGRDVLLAVELGFLSITLIGTTIYFLKTGKSFT